MDKVFAVFGLGTFGFQICKVLSERGGQVIAVDRQEKLIDRIKDDVTQAVLLDSTDEDALRNIGLENVDVAIVAIGDDIDASILTTALLKNLGVPMIIARAVSEIHAQVLKQVGATEVINIEIEEGKMLAKRLVASDVLDIIPISKNQSLVELYVPKEFVGKSLMQLNLRKKFKVNVISIKRTVTVVDNSGNPLKEEVVLSPRPTDILQPNDVLVVVGNEKDIESLKEP
jgi:trk system potassium uptake protein TrkA